MALQKEILSCLWSADLKRYLEENPVDFSENDLLTMAYHFAPTFEERLRLLGLVAKHCPGVSDYAARCIAWQRKCLNHFRRHSVDEVYELRILDKPGAYEERYLCESYEAALEMIDGFYAEYDFAPEAETVRYTIAKRSILHSGQPFREDELGEVILSAGKVLISVSDIPGESENGPCSHSCPKCAAPCIEIREVDSFPAFLLDRSPVRYRFPSGREEFGIHLRLNWNGPGAMLYIIPLDSEMMNERSFDKDWGWHWHEHISAPWVTSAPLSQLPEKLRENYKTFTAWLDTRPDL